MYQVNACFPSLFTQRFSHCIYCRGNFLFRTVPASRSNLSFKSCPCSWSAANFPSVWIARNGPLVCCWCRALSRYRSYARDRKRKTHFWSHNGTFSRHLSKDRMLLRRTSFHIVNDYVLWYEFITAKIVAYYEYLIKIMTVNIFYLFLPTIYTYMRKYCWFPIKHWQIWQANNCTFTVYRKRIEFSAQRMVNMICILILCS